MKSIIQDERECYLTGRTDHLEEHHVFFGKANRKLSEEYGLKVWLTKEWHTGRAGVHSDYKLNIFLKKKAQEMSMEHYGWTTEDFIKIFGRNYI